jgi:hypothetical protein
LNLKGTEMPNQKFPKGARVVLSEQVENYPVGIFAAGLTGTVVDYSEVDDAYWVKLDRHRPELAEWDNQLQIMGDEGEWPAERYLKLDTRPSAERHLVRLYDHWLEATGLPSMSANELAHELFAQRESLTSSNARKLSMHHHLIDYQVEWLLRFATIWEQRVEGSY